MGRHPEPQFTTTGTYDYYLTSVCQDYDDNDYTTLTRLHPLQRAVRIAKMAATSTIVLSSSPCGSAIAITPPHGKPVAMSSSPSLPSPSQLFSSMHLRFPSRSRAVSIFKDPVVGFASASTLLRQARGADEPESPSGAKRMGLSAGSEMKDTGNIPAKLRKGKGAKEKNGKEKVVKDKKPVFKTPGLLQDDDTNPAQPDTVDVGPNHPPKASKDDGPAVMKPRKKKNKEEGDGQTKIKQAKVTKPGAAKSIGKPKKPATTTKKAKESVVNTSKVPVSTQDSDLQAREEFRELCLEKAIPIRRDWTPVRDTVQNITTVANIEGFTGSALLQDAPSTNALPNARFGKLVSDFGFAQPDEGTATMLEAIRPMNGEALIKRRKIELVNEMSALPPAEKNRRTKSPKKLQTVTAKATAPFMPIESLETPSLLQYFGATLAGPEDLLSGQVNKSGTPVTTMGKPPARRTTKAKPVMVKTKKAIQPILLSPESAMKTAKDQELVFGTSSQLAREDSPMFLKDIQQAMKESESIEGNWASSQPSAKFKPYNSLALMQSRNLWSIASRDLEGSLLDAEVVDLSETPKLQKTVSQLPPPPVVSDLLAARPRQTESERIEAEVTSNTLKLDLESTPGLQQQVAEPELVMPRSVAEAALRKRPKSRSPVKKSVAAKPAPDKMPNYKGFTDIQLRKAVAAYGFKSIKKREAMIVLLEQCFESKVAMALQEVPVNANLPQAQPDHANNESPKKCSPAKKRGRPPKVSSSTTAADSDKKNDVPAKKPRGRPRKDLTAMTPPPKRKRKATSPTRAQAETAALAADDIYDSSPPTPSPPRRRSPPKSPAQLRLSQTAGTTTTIVNAATTSGQKLLFESMTRAITTFPPTHDPRSLTFYEKMLMYEPVVLEDLAVWLNAEGLGRVGEDNEVSPAQVKEWCEERSICCLWRENLRGGSRGRW